MKFLKKPKSGAVKGSDNIAHFAINSIAKKINHQHFLYWMDKEVLSGSLIKKDKKLLKKWTVPVVTMCLIISVFISCQIFGDSHGQAIDQKGSSTEVNNDSNPSKSKPSDQDFSFYSPQDPKAPRYISISRLDIKARVMSLGLKPGGQLEAPANIYDAGWYKTSSFPGQPGAVLIDGHSGDPNAIFINLKDLVGGDIILIERGDGKKIKYKVVQTEVLPKDSVDMSRLMVPFVVGTNGLNIITCDGQFDSNSSSYNNRLIVYAKQV
jgi:LPXTG-site transpeptidase (sortase) family protein